MKKKCEYCGYEGTDVFEIDGHNMCDVCQSDYESEMIDYEYTESLY